MNFEMKEVLAALGPTASLVFAAWIFLSFLQARYTAAYQLYRSLLSEFRERGREQSHSPERREQIESQIWTYKRRCEYMRTSTNLGVTAALFIVTGLIASALQLTVAPIAALKLVGIGGIVIGLLFVIAAASYVLLENIQIKSAMDAEIADLPELTDKLRSRRPGSSPRSMSPPSRSHA